MISAAEDVRGLVAEKEMGPYLVLSRFGVEHREQEIAVTVAFGTVRRENFP
jgi:hypothetical protein